MSPASLKDGGLKQRPSFNMFKTWAEQVLDTDGAEKNKLVTAARKLQLAVSGRDGAYRGTSSEPRVWNIAVSKRKTEFAEACQAFVRAHPSVDPTDDRHGEVGLFLQALALATTADARALPES